MASNDIHILNNKYPDYVAQVLRNYRHNFTVIALDSAIFTFSMAMLAQDTILPYFVSMLSDNPLFTGLLAALFLLGNYFPQIIGAYLVQGKPRKKGYILTIAILERVAILLIALIATSLGKFSPQTALILFFIAYSLFTMTLGLMAPAYADFISKAIVKNRGLFYGVMIGLGGGIGFIASLIATRLLESYAYPQNFQAVFWIGFALSFISPFLIAMYKEVPLPDVEPRESFGEFVRTVPARITGNANFRGYLILRALAGLGLMGNSFYSLYAMRQYDISSGSIGIFTMLILMAQSLMGVVWGWVGDKFGYKRVLLGMITLMTLQGLLAWVNPGLWAFYLIAAMIGGAYAAASVGDPNIIFELAPPAETSRYVGISNSILGPVYAMAPLLGGLIVRNINHQVLFTTIFLLEAMVFLLTLFLWREPRVTNRADASA